MKKIISYISVALIILSCEDSLEEVPKDFVSNTNFWQTAADAEAGVRGIYEVDQQLPWNDQFLELHSDFGKGRGSWASISNWDKPMDPTHIGRAQNYFWNLLYLAVKRANTVLANVPDIEMNEDSKSALLAEARFMRAWQYFILVRAYGAVPLRLEATVDLSSIDSPRMPEADIYTQIIADLQVSEVDLPTSIGDNTRRPTRWTAKMLLAQVYLTMENWDLAATKAEEVINSGEYAIISVSEPDDFYKIFAERPTSEDVMSIHFSPTIRDSYPATLHLSNIPGFNENSRGFFTTLPVTTTIIGDAWDDNDLRKSFNLYTEYFDSNGDTVALPETSPILFKKIISSPDGSHSTSRYYLRFTENYLIYAEAAAMSAGAPTAQALEYLNIIRRRAYGHDPFSVSPDDYPAGMSITDFRDAVIMERAYEFINEQRRWFDLKRTGKAKEAIEAAFGVTFNDARLFWPLPQDEINNNADITQSDQNPGY